MATFVFSIFLGALTLLSVVGQDQDKPKLEGSFQSYFKKSEIELLLEPNSSQILEIDFGLILFDEKANTLAIHYEKDRGNNLGSVILNYTTKEKLKIQDNQCYVEEAVEIDDAVYPFASVIKNDGSKMKSSDILLFDRVHVVCSQDSGSKDFICTGEKNLTTEDDMIPCNLTHWFSKPDVRKYWDLQKIDVSCSGRFQVIFEFYHFENKITAPEELQQPLGIFCPDRNSSNPVPSLPDRFRLTLEDFVTQDKIDGATILSTEVWYDAESEIILEDSRVNWGKTDSLKIYEYKRGVQYSINSLMKSCQIAALDERNQKMKPKDSYFWLQNAQYVGKKRSDGVEYDVWATKPPNDESLVGNIFYIELLSRSIQDEEKVKIPVKKAEYTYNGKHILNSQYTRVLHYEYMPIDWSVFDMTYCFDSNNQTVPFELRIEGPVLPFNAIPAFQETVHMELLASANVAATRISNFQIHRMPTDEHGAAIITGIITENPAILGVGKELKEGSAEESYQNLVRRVRNKDFIITVKAATHSEKLTYSATRVDRMSKRGYKIPLEVVEPEIPPSFQTEFTLYYSRSIYHGSLLFDDTRKTMAIHFQEGTEKRFYFYNIVNNEESIITGWRCQTKKVDKDIIRIFPFDAISLHHKSKAGPKSRSILLFDGENKTFVGEEMDAFQRKFQKWGSTKEILIDGLPTNCDVTHWFEVDDDKTTTLEAITLSCVLPESNDQHAVEIIFHLGQFASAVKNPGELQQPAGIYCENKSSIVTLPQLPDRFRIGADTLMGSKEAAISSSIELWYDTESQLIRKDEKASFNSLHTVTISEYKRGVEYYIQVPNDECKILNLTASDNKMLSKDEILTFGVVVGQPPQFVGQRIVNGIPHDVWSYASKDMSQVAEMSFVREAETISLLADVPVQVEVFNHNKNTHASYRLFSYDLNPSDWSIFDLTPCFDANQKIQFQLEIEGSMSISYSLMPTFMEQVHQELLKHLQVSSTRVSNFQIHRIPTDEGGSAVITGVITDNPAILGVGKDLKEGSAEESYQNLVRRVKNKDFNINVKAAAHSQNVTYSATGIDRISRKGHTIPLEVVKPEIPPSFQTEFTLYFFRSIYHGSLLYDDARKTMAIHFQEGTEKSFYIYNTVSGEESTITGLKCLTKTVESDVISIFPFAAKSLHHKSKAGSKSESILLFDGEDKTFVGEEIDAFQRKFQKWGSTKEILMDQQPMNCDLTHWFVVDDDKTTTLQAITVSCVLPKSNDQNAVEIIFHLGQFASAVKNPEELQQPAGIYCENKLTVMTLPQLPDRFRIGADTLMGSSEAAISSSIELWYDAELQLLRKDEKVPFNSLHTVTISEYKRGVEYYLQVLLDECKILNLTASDTKILSKEEILTFGVVVDQPPQFVGQRIVNGIPHYVWSYASKDMTQVAEMLYVKEAETISLQADVPVQVEVFNHKKNTHATYRLFSYDLNPSDWSIFDLTHCFDANQKIQFQLAIEGSRSVSYASMPTFKEQVHQQLLKYLKVSSTRVSNFQIFHVGGIAMVTGVLTEDPVNLGFGNTGSSSSEATAEQALQNLVDSVQNKAFTFQIKPTGKEDEVIFTGRTVERLTTDSKQVSSGYSSGSMATLGLCLLIVGGLLGSVIFMIYFKFKQPRGFQHHRDDGL